MISLAAAASSHGAYGDEVEPSTQPIGSPFFRHLAADYNLDLKDLVKLEERGFGRAETVTLILISSATGTYFKDLAKRRLKEKILLKDLAAEANLNYAEVAAQAQNIKRTIEAKGDRDLPPPVFVTPTPVPEPKKNKDGKKKKKTKEQSNEQEKLE